MKVQSVLYNYIILLNWEKRLSIQYGQQVQVPYMHSPLKMKKTPNSLQKFFWEPKIFSKIQGEEHHEDIRS